MTRSAPLSVAHWSEQLRFEPSRRLPKRPESPRLHALGAVENLLRCDVRTRQQR